MAVEHAMFTFDDLKVTSHYDRMTTKVLSSRPRINAARPKIGIQFAEMLFIIQKEYKKYKGFL